MFYTAPIISRVLVHLFNNPIVSAKLAFKGGTALNKLFFNPPARYSEDIDLVQVKAEPIGNVLDAIHQSLDHWLGKPKWKFTKYSAKFFYTINSVEGNLIKLKIEINTTEHYHVKPIVAKPYEIISDWFTGNADIKTYELNELMGTKLKALFQRNKGRDLFDMWLVLSRDLINIDEVIDIFHHYTSHENQHITRAMFEQNMHKKLQSQEFSSDMSALLSGDIDWDYQKAIDIVHEEIISKFPGAPWKTIVGT